MDKPFDAKFHDQDHEIEDKEKKGGTCGVIVQEGYMFNDKVLRKAKVGKVKKSWGLFWVPFFLDNISLVDIKNPVKYTHKPNQLIYALKSIDLKL